MDILRSTEKPFQIWGVLDKKEAHHSGYMTREEAEASLAQIKEKADALKLKTKYVIKPLIKKE